MVEFSFRTFEDVQKAYRHILEEIETYKYMTLNRFKQYVDELNGVNEWRAFDIYDWEHGWETPPCFDIRCVEIYGLNRYILSLEDPENLSNTKKEDDIMPCKSGRYPWGEEEDKKIVKNEGPKFVDLYGKDACYEWGIPKVTAVETYNDRVVLIRFADGTFTKAVCSENDTFDLDIGITICLFKRFMSPIIGTKCYATMLKYVHRRMDEIEKEKEKVTEEKAKAREKQKRAEEKRMKKGDENTKNCIALISAGVAEGMKQHYREQCVCESKQTE